MAGGSTRIREPQGWRPDPFGRYEQRYFSAGRPTRLVRSHGVEDRDEPAARAIEAPDPPPAAEEPPGEPSASFTPRLYERRPHPWRARLLFALTAVAVLAGIVGLSPFRPFALMLLTAIGTGLGLIVATRSRSRAG